MKYSVLILTIFLGSCAASKRVDNSTEPLSTVSTVTKGDTLKVVSPDTLGVHQMDKTTILSQLFQGKKVKNTGTIIIQTGEKPVASAIEKAKAPVAVSEEPASSVQVVKPKAPVALTTGTNSPATATETHKKDYSWLLYLLLAGLAGYGYYKYKTR